MFSPGLNSVLHLKPIVAETGGLAKCHPQPCFPKAQIAESVCGGVLAIANPVITLCLSLIPLLQPEAGMHQCIEGLWVFHQQHLSMADVLQPAGDRHQWLWESRSLHGNGFGFVFHVFCECYSTVNVPSLCLLINGACNIYDKHYYRFLNKTHYATPVSHPHQSSCQ